MLIEDRERHRPSVRRCVRFTLRDVLNFNARMVGQEKADLLLKVLNGGGGKYFWNHACIFPHDSGQLAQGIKLSTTKQGCVLLEAMDANEIAKKLAEQSAKETADHWDKIQGIAKKIAEQSPKESLADYDKVLELERRSRERKGWIGNLIFWVLVALIILAITAIRH